MWTLDDFTPIRRFNTFFLTQHEDKLQPFMAGPDFVPAMASNKPKEAE